MDLAKNGELLRALRKAKGLTQKDVAERLGVVAKTVSKWETGHGFPDVSLLSQLADVLGVNERSLINGCLNENKKQVMNIKQTKFYLCPSCGGFFSGVGDCSIFCCGKLLEPLCATPFDEEHGQVVKSSATLFKNKIDRRKIVEAFTRSRINEMNNFQ